jgi:hypothetical protein
VLGLGCFDFLLSGGFQLSNMLVVDVHIRSKELHYDTPLVLGSNSPSIEPPVRAIESFNPNCPRELLSSADGVAPSFQVFVSVIGVKASPGISSEIGCCLTSVREVPAVDPNDFSSLRESYKHMSR